MGEKEGGRERRRGGIERESKREKQSTYVYIAWIVPLYTIHITIQVLYRRGIKLVVFASRIYTLGGG